MADHGLTVTDETTAMPVTTRALVGTVVAFDDDSGLGIVSSEEGSYPFHCTAVADGSRHADAGATVMFRVAPGHAGRNEARDIVVAQRSSREPSLGG